MTEDEERNACIVLDETLVQVEREGWGAATQIALQKFQQHHYSPLDKLNGVHDLS